ncbi:MAG: Hsp70 family protein [Syntrophomonadaceae bacterium]|nr:Hsp70 family protein [Syntrophomonadaceae bacterium]MDD3889188.1 Hsp70 family protein [Syntrophomonadaceae bacterium]MDD4549817.1 Hsp70 family protein [Syntrophomonadaceae bacterium]
MHLGIDFGTSFTKIGFTDKGNFISLTGEAKIPTAITYLPSQDKLYFGSQALRLSEPGAYTARFFKLYLKRNPNFSISQFTLEDILRQYFSFLKNKCVQPQINNITGVSISVPNYFGLKARNLLLKTTADLFNLDQINLIPEPVAALIGYNAVHPQAPLKGDILIIDIGGGTTDFSFINTSHDIYQVTIESQFQIGHDAFSGSEVDRGILHHILLPAYQMQTGQTLPSAFLKEKNLPSREQYLWNQMMQYAEKLKIELSNSEETYINIPDFFNGNSLQIALTSSLFLDRLQLVYSRLKTYFNECVKPRAALLGLYDENRWQLDYILLLGGASQTRGVEQLISELCPGVPLICPDDREFNVVRGVCNLHDHVPLSIKTIYPFTFYIEKFDYNSKEYFLEKIPFDTSNLELDIKGSYKLFSLPVDSPYNLSSDPDQAIFRIYEVAEEDQNASAERFMGQELALHLQSERNALPEVLDIYLNLAESKLETNLSGVTQSNNAKHLFSDLQLKQENFLKLINHYKFYNSRLNEDFTEHLQQINRQDLKPYQEHAETTYYKLISLLQLYSGK